MLSNNLSYLLGALRDGSLPVCKVKSEVTLATDTNPEGLRIVAGLAADEFGLPLGRFKIYEVWDKKSTQACFRLKIYSRDAYEKLTEYYPPGNQLRWATPKVLLEASLDRQLDYLAAFYDAEGGCRDVERFVRGDSRTIQGWASIRCKHDGSNEPLQFLRDILANVGVTSQIYDSDELVLTGRGNLLRFYKTVSLRHPRKRMQLWRLLQFFGPLGADA